MKEFKNFLIDKLFKNYGQYYNTFEEFKTHFDSGEVKIPVNDINTLVDEYESKQKNHDLAEAILTPNDGWKPNPLAFSEENNISNVDDKVEDKIAAYIEKYRYDNTMTSHRIARSILTTNPESTFFIKDENFSNVDEAAEIKCYNHLKYVYDRYSIDWDESDSAKVAMVLFELEKNIIGEEIIESLEEAAENYASKPYYRNGGTLSVAPQLYLKRGFIAGVKWYASQLNRTEK